MAPQGVIVVRAFCFLVEQQGWIVWQEMNTVVFPEPVINMYLRHVARGFKITCLNIIFIQFLKKCTKNQ